METTEKDLHTTINQETEQESGTITITREDLHNAILKAMDEDPLDELITKQPVMILAFAVMAATVERVLFNSEKEKKDE